MGTQLESFLTERNNKGRSILDMVAHYGDKTSFAAVLNAIRARLTHDQYDVLIYGWECPFNRTRLRTYPTLGHSHFFITIFFPHQNMSHLAITNNRFLGR